jgi:hypothetical protein
MLRSVKISDVGSSEGISLVTFLKEDAILIKSLDESVEISDV